MGASHQASRREFIKVAGLSVGITTFARTAAARAAEQPAGRRESGDVLARLLEGNKRYVDGRSTRVARTPKDFSADAQGQAPIAAIVGCADSRVGPELIFDQGVGDLFVVRVAGNVVSGAGPIVKGSLEYAVAELGVKLIMVLGHSQCGAVKAAVAHIDAKDALPGSISELVNLIKPAVDAAKGKPGDKLTNVIKANVERCAARLKGLDPIVSKFVDKKELKIVGAVYELSTGRVEVIA